MLTETVALEFPNVLHNYFNGIKLGDHQLQPCYICSQQTPVLQKSQLDCLQFTIKFIDVIFLLFTIIFLFDIVILLFITAIYLFINLMKGIHKEGLNFF